MAVDKAHTQRALCVKGQTVLLCGRPPPQAPPHNREEAEEEGEGAEAVRAAAVGAPLRACLVPLLPPTRMI